MILRHPSAILHAGEGEPGSPLFSRDVIHATGVPVCTGGLTRATEREKGGCEEEEGVAERETEAGVIIEGG